MIHSFKESMIARGYSSPPATGRVDPDQAQAASGPLRLHDIGRSLIDVNQIPEYGRR